MSGEVVRSYIELVSPVIPLGVGDAEVDFELGVNGMPGAGRIESIRVWLVVGDAATVDAMAIAGFTGVMIEMQGSWLFAVPATPPSGSSEPDILEENNGWGWGFVLRDQDGIRVYLRAAGGTIDSQYRVGLTLVHGAGRSVVP